jgi:methylated-DNA-[protein]-cysteine S-methyltransferase
MFNQIYKGSFGMIEVICDQNYVISTRFIDSMVDVNPNHLTKLAVKQIREYDQGNRVNFELPIKFAHNFTSQVLKVLSQLNGDKVYSYKELAILCGKQKAYRAIGTVMSKNQHPLIIPCHLIIKSDGTIGNYRYGSKLKAELIKINLKNGGSYE